jgi:hypothetical protein
VLSAYSKWVERHYRERRGLTDFNYDLSADAPVPGVPQGHTIHRDRFVGRNGEVVRFVWAYPSDADGGLEWRNEVRIGAFGTDCAVEHLISISSIDYRITPAQLALGSPGVIRNLCSENVVQIGDMRVKATPYPLAVGDVGKFLELLQSSKRRLPIVFVSPYANGDANALDTTSMAQHLAGVGIVIEVRDAEATWDIADAIGRTLSCFDGGARIYWPGFSPTHDPRRHRLYLGARIGELGSETVARSIERSIFGVAAFRFVPDPRFNDVIREVEQTERLQRVEVEKASSGEDWENYALELDEKLSSANQTIAELQAENENLKANQQVYFSARAFGEADDDVASEEAPPPDSVEAAVEQASVGCSNLVILHSAFDAARNSPFQRPAEVLAALRDLNEIAADWVKQREAKGSGGDLLQHLKNRGWGKRSSMHISDTTKTRYGANYTFEYGGKRQLFEPHITLGSGDPNSCASIHFQLDHERGKIVIAHVGRHLPNTKT